MTLENMGPAKKNILLFLFEKNPRKSPSPQAKILGNYSIVR
jgi:hypothetical protein